MEILEILKEVKVDFLAYHKAFEDSCSDPVYGLCYNARTLKKETDRIKFLEYMILNTEPYRYNALGQRYKSCNIERGSWIWELNDFDSRLEWLNKQINKLEKRTITKDVQIIKQLYDNNHLEPKELERAGQLLRLLNQQYKFRTK